MIQMPEDADAAVDAMVDSAGELLTTGRYGNEAPWRTWQRDERSAVVNVRAEYPDTVVDAIGDYASTVAFLNQETPDWREYEDAFSGSPWPDAMVADDRFDFTYTREPRGDQNMAVVNWINTFGHAIYAAMEDDAGANGMRDNLHVVASRFPEYTEEHDIIHAWDEQIRNEASDAPYWQFPVWDVFTQHERTGLPEAFERFEQHRAHAREAAADLIEAVYEARQGDEDAPMHVDTISINVGNSDQSEADDGFGVEEALNYAERF